MGSREDLGKELRALLKKPNVYFQPPESVKLSFPCFIYSLEDMDVKRADNKAYNLTKSYQVNYISKDPDDELVKKIVESFELIRFERVFIADGLYHYVYKLYW